MGKKCDGFLYGTLAYCSWCFQNENRFFNDISEMKLFFYMGSSQIKGQYGVKNDGIFIVNFLDIFLWA